MLIAVLQQMQPDITPEPTHGWWWHNGVALGAAFFALVAAGVQVWFNWIGKRQYFVFEARHKVLAGAIVEINMAMAWAIDYAESLLADSLVEGLRQPSRNLSECAKRGPEFGRVFDTYRVRIRDEQLERKISTVALGLHYIMYTYGDGTPYFDGWEDLFARKKIKSPPGNKVDDANWYLEVISPLVVDVREQFRATLLGTKPRQRSKRDKSNTGDPEAATQKER